MGDDFVTVQGMPFNEDDQEDKLVTKDDSLDAEHQVVAEHMVSDVVVIKPTLKIDIPGTTLGDKKKVRVMTLNRLKNGGYMCIGDLQKPFDTFQEAYNHYIRAGAVRMEEAKLEGEWIDFLTAEQNHSVGRKDFGEILAVFELI